MAENLDSPSFNFSIQDTMEMGLGNAELLNDLVAPETASGNPDEIKEIVKEVEAPKPAEAAPAPKGKELAASKDDADAQDTLKNFLLDATDEEEEEADNQEVSAPKKAAPKAPKAGELKQEEIGRAHV